MADLSYSLYDRLLNLYIIINRCLNCMIFLDLYLMIRNPFKSRKYRVKFYYGITIILMIVLSVLNPLNTFGDAAQGYAYNYIFLGIVTLLINVSSIIVARNLCRRGTSKHLKRLVYIRHFVYLLMYDLLLYANYVFLSSTEQCFYKYFINYVQEVIISLVAIIRLVEPHVFSTLRYELRRMRILCSSQKIER